MLTAGLGGQRRAGDTAVELLAAQLVSELLLIEGAIEAPTDEKGLVAIVAELAVLLEGGNLGEGREELLIPHLEILPLGRVVPYPFVDEGLQYRFSGRRFVHGLVGVGLLTQVVLIGLLKVPQGDLAVPHHGDVGQVGVP